YRGTCLPRLGLTTPADTVDPVTDGLVSAIHVISLIRCAAVPHPALRATLPTNGKWAGDKKRRSQASISAIAKNSEPCWPPTGTIAAVTRHRRVGGWCRSNTTKRR